MIRYYRPAALALLLFFAVQLRPVYRVSIGSERIPGFFSASQVRQAQEAAREAAEELLPREAVTPVPRVSLRLRLRRSDGDTGALTDALLRGDERVVLADAVRVNGTPLGTVTDGEALLEQLREMIRSGMPAGAAVGELGGRLQIRRVYTRSGSEREYEDVLADILRAAPVFYLDGSGKLA